MDSAQQLGVYSNPAGDSTDNVKFRRGKNITIVSRVLRSSISQIIVVQLYRNIWLPAMQYPLAVTFFLKEHCVRIMKPFVQAILPKLGFNRNTTREIILEASNFPTYTWNRDT
eukprot:9280273-Ditylum_brightwellii.AAC.1